MLDAIRVEEAGKIACGRRSMSGGHAGAMTIIASAPVRVMDSSVPWTGQKNSCPDGQEIKLLEVTEMKRTLSALLIVLLLLGATSAGLATTSGRDVITLPDMSPIPTPEGEEEAMEPRFNLLFPLRTEHVMSSGTYSVRPLNVQSLALGIRVEYDYEVLGEGNLKVTREVYDAETGRKLDVDFSFAWHQVEDHEEYEMYFYVVNFLETAEKVAKAKGVPFSRSKFRIETETLRQIVEYCGFDTEVRDGTTMSWNQFQKWFDNEAKVIQPG